jgi:predicted amidophosphoribosyltransferase
VMTTGSTLAAAAAALRAAGAQRIEIWVAAQAQRRDLLQTT